MKFKLKTLFLITLIIAVVVGSVTTSLRLMSTVRSLRDTVDRSLAELNADGSLQITKSQYQSDFGVFSDGTSVWDIEMEEKSRARIELKWRSRLWFADEPSITIQESDSAEQQEFADQFIRVFRTHKTDMGIVVE